MSANCKMEMLALTCAPNTGLLSVLPQGAEKLLCGKASYEK